MEVVHPDSLEIVALNQAAIEIAHQISGEKGWDNAPLEVRIKAYEFAVLREQARMKAECADSIARLAESIKSIEIYLQQ